MNARIWVFRIFAGALVLGAVVHVSMLLPRVGELADALPSRAWLPVAGYAVSALTALLACALAALLMWKAPQRADARVLALFMAFLAIFWGSLFRFLKIDGTGTEVSVELSYGGGWVSQSALVSLLLAMAAFLRFSALFPQPLTAERLPPPRYFRALRRLRVATLRPLPVWGSVAAILIIQTFGLDVVARVAGVETAEESVRVQSLLLGTLFFVIGLAALFALSAIVLGMRNLRASYRMASANERKRILWVVSGFSLSSWMVLAGLGILVVIVTTSLDVTALGVAVPLVLVLAPLVLVASATIGVLYSGALDSALVLRASTMYGALAATGVVAFAGIENALSGVLEDRLALPGALGSVIAGAVVAAALFPLRGAVRLWLKGRRASELTAE
jgi:hypothetical protein